MGYFDETQLPAYGFLAEEFTVCDQWYSSVRGATWPKRLYALAGRAAGSKDNPAGVPRYNVPSFVRRLDAANVS
jgi:phospholipase C